MRQLLPLLVFALLTLLPGPVCADGLETATEKAVGRVASRALMDASGVDTDPLLQDWVKRIGAKVAARSPRKDIRPEFTILGTGVANAFTLPGGGVFVTRGLLDSVDSDDELAAVLAHETGHVAKKHAIQQIEGNLLFVVAGLTLRRTGNEDAAAAASVYNLFRALNKSREMEAQADEEGIAFAYEAGYDPHGLIEFFNGIAGGRPSFLDTYLATHPAPSKRIEAARANPLVTETDAAIRETVAKGYAERGFPNLAQLVRRSQNPLQIPPPDYPPLDSALRAERSDLVQQASEGRRALVPAFKARRVGITLQQLLLINSNLGDLRWAYLASRAYMVQSQVDDLYARTLRVMRTAPDAYDGLAAYASLGMDDLTGRDTARGRSEVRQSVTRVRGAVKPLGRASAAAAAVLADLNNHYLRPRGNSEPWLRYSALEGTLRYAESELGRADKASGQAWRLLSVAQVRRYEARLSELVPVDDPQRRALWQRLMTDRFGISGAFEAGETKTGAVTVRAALSRETSQSTDALDRDRAGTPWADWIAPQNGIPENIATAMRLLTLDLERETAAGERIKRTGIPMILSGRN
ncbi:MAG: M48 family metalloprotease [Cytophagales bacterium]|nr:M48 family metalloprotease [Armatimonadota bacterium]